MIPKTKKRKAPPSKFRSKSEARVAENLPLGTTYEDVRFSFPCKPRTYLADIILPNGIVIEVKGWFTPADRAKMKAVKAAHPGMDIRMVFDTPHQWTTKRKTMTNAQWAEKHGFPWAAKMIPQSWIDEPRNEKSIAAIEERGTVVKCGIRKRRGVLA